MTPQRVLLTGGTGFVGAQILKALKNRDAYVRLVSRNTNNTELADDICVTDDLFSENTSWWSECLQDIDIIIHSAWYVEPGKYLFSDENAYCLQGSLELIEAFMESEAQHFVGIGTCFEYDTDAGHLSVDTPLKPITPYATAKVELFKALSEATQNTKKTCAWCRLFYLFGEKEHPKRLVPYLHQKLQNGLPIDLTSGQQVRDFMDVQEAGRDITLAALSHKQGPINICSGKAITVRELSEKIADEYGRRDLLNFGARDDNLVDPPVIVGVPNL